MIVSVTVETASFVLPISNWTGVDAATPAQPAAGVTEKVALVWGVEAVLEVRVALALVRATVRPPPGEAGKTMTIVAEPTRAVVGVTVMVPGVATPVSTLQETVGEVTVSVVACAVAARLVNATSAKSAFDPLVFITDKSMKDRPFLRVFSTTSRGGGLVIWPLQALSAGVNNALGVKCGRDGETAGETACATKAKGSFPRPATSYRSDRRRVISEPLQARSNSFFTSAAACVFC